MGAMLTPAPLDAGHDVDTFENGRAPALDAWLRQKAKLSEGLSARTYVICPREESARIVGYATLSTGQARLGALPSAKLRRNMPDPVPVVLLGRLAIDRNFQGRGIGTGLLKAALRRSLEASAIIGLRAIFVHAIDDEAAAFYRARGFVDSPEKPLVLLMPIERIATILQSSAD